LIHSLIGQSEVLTISGMGLYLTGHETFGIVMICLGVLGSLVRFSVNMSFLQNQSTEDIEENEENIDDLKKILKEIKNNFKPQ